MDALIAVLLLFTAATVVLASGFAAAFSKGAKE